MRLLSAYITNVIRYILVRLFEDWDVIRFLKFFSSFIRKDVMKGEYPHLLLVEISKIKITNILAALIGHSIENIRDYD